MNEGGRGNRALVQEIPRGAEGHENWRGTLPEGGRAGKGYAPQHGKISAGRLEKVSVKIK